MGPSLAGEILLFYLSGAVDTVRRDSSIHPLLQSVLFPWPILLQRPATPSGGTRGTDTMALVILRIIFIFASVGLAIRLINTDVMARVLPNSQLAQWAVLAAMVLAAASVLTADLLLRNKRLITITSVYFGLIIGLFLTYVLHLALNPIYPVPMAGSAEWRTWVQLVMGLFLCYTCISVLLQTKDDFRFVIPYVEFSKEVKSRRPYVLDTSVVIDGRIADVVETNILDNVLVMPRFVIAELQGIADSSERTRRARGRRGLDIMNRLRDDPKVDLEIYEKELPEFEGKPVDERLVLLAKELNGRIVTNDFNLNKVAQLHGVAVINLNDIANALKPVFMAGENLDVRIIKAGEEAGQGVGYLDDGTMIVVESGREYVGKTVEVHVTSVLQTSAGRMIFGKVENGNGDA
jgi:uncharacterized protein YacL